MRFRDAMAPRLYRRAWIVLALFPLLPLVALWPRIPAQAEPDDGALKISLAGEILTLEARSVPLDRLLDGLAAASDFAVAVKCGAAGCPTIRGRLRGTLGEVLDQILHGHGYSRTFGPASATDQRPKLRRLVVLTASSDRSGRPEALATLDSNESAMFADLMRWASRESRNPFPAKPARGEGPAHLWFSSSGWSEESSTGKSLRR